MERPIFKPVGTPVEEIDTPALVVDVDVLKQNIETLHSFFREQESKVRPHIGAHRCPAIAHEQLRAGGTTGGICVTSVGQAEVFAQNGIEDIFVANEIVTPLKIGKLCALAHNVNITVAVDNPRNVIDLSEAAQASDVTLRVVVDINTHPDRCGVEPGRPAVELAKAVARSPNLHFAGLMTNEGRVLLEDPEELAMVSRRYIQQVLDTREMVEKAGMEVEIISAGGTHNYDVVGKMSGVTEVPAGSYALMDYRYLQYRKEFRPAARVLATVTSHPEPKVVILDTGAKAVGTDTGLPNVERIPGARVKALHAEHGVLDVEGPAQQALDQGHKVWLTPWDIGICVNLNDYIRAVRDGKLEAMWDISARGRYR